MHSQRKIHVSVIIVTLNRARSLIQTLEGLRHQTYPEFEVIVVNGPSTDDTDAVLRKFGSDVRIDNCPEANIGQSRNMGLAMAAGDIIAFIDDDAVPNEHWIEQLISAYDRPAVAAAGGWVFNVPLALMEWRNCTCTRAGDVSLNAEPPVAAYITPGADPFLFLPGCNMSFRRSVLAEIGSFNEEYIYGYDDVEICRRIIDADYTIAQMGEKAVVYHSPEMNICRRSDGLIHDVYFFLRARAIFALEIAMKPEQDELAVQKLAEAADFWRQTSQEYLANGRRTVEEHQKFVQRIDDAIRDGVATGRLSRARRTPPKLPPRASLD